MAQLWSAEADATLRASLESGATYSEAAYDVNRAHGTAFSRNAAIGRASRLGLKSTSGRNGPCPEAEQRPRVCSSRKPKSSATGEPPSAPISATPCLDQRDRLNGDGSLVAEKVEPASPSMAQPAGTWDLLDLGAGQCRYPFGEGPFTFCGCAVNANAMFSYCTEHLKIVLAPARARAA